MSSPITVTGLGLADTPGSFVTRPLNQVALTWGGLEGDRHFGLTMKSNVRQKHHPRGTELRNSRQLSILSDEELALIASDLDVPRVSFEWLGGNLCLRGLESLTRLAPSTRLRFPSGACLAVDSENLPCTGPGKIIHTHFPAAPKGFASRFVKAALNRRGLVAWVESPGRISLGDEVQAFRP